jgi:hypothetical protein
VTSQQQQQMLQQQQQHQQQSAAAAAATLPRQRQPPNHPSAKSKTGTLNAQMTTASQFATLERNMAEVAQRNRESRAELTTNQANTLGRQSRYGDNSCDTCDAPLTPASLAGIDHRDLEHRPLTRSVTRATVYDEPPERTSLFITISGLYGLFLVVVCIAFLASEVATHSVPLHYFEGLFTYLYIVSILFLLYVFCFLLHEYSCCGRAPTQPTVRNAYFHNLPADALPDGPVREKMANFKRPKKFKTSENDFSHGSFFLRIGGITFGLGTMIYNGMELGTFFEIPWTSPCYQVLRGINPILQMIFTFSQMYFVFMNARLNIHKFKCVARFGLMHIAATNLCVWLRTVVKECTKEIAQYRVDRGHGVSEDYMILEGYNTLRRKFGDNSFLVNGPYSAIMSAFTPPDGTDGLWGFNIPGFSDQNEGPMSTTLPSTAALAQALAQPAPQQNYAAAPYYSQTIPPMTGPNNVLMGNRFANNQGIINLANNFTCGRSSVMGNIVTYAGPYLYPFVVEYSLIGAAVVFAMWRSIGSNPRYRGEDDDRMSIASRKMTAYAKTDCIGASKGLFFGLITLVLGVISLILFFVLIDNDNQQIGKMAVFLADISHCAILLASILAIFLGFLRVQKLKFHGEDQSVLGDTLLRFAAIGIFAYSTFNIVVGALSVHRDPKNLLILATGGISIIQVMLQLLFITDAQRRRIHSNDHNSSKPGRQVVTFLLICNITMWIIYTFEVQKVKDSPVQLRFFGFYAWSMIQRICLPMCIFFRFHSSVILVEIWKNSYKTKLMD